MRYIQKLKLREEELKHQNDSRNGIKSGKQIE
jgi:hypothetical protein